MGITRRILLIVCAALPLCAFAQEPPFPQRGNVEITVLFPAGTSANVTARLLAEGMSKQLRPDRARRQPPRRGRGDQLQVRREPETRRLFPGVELELDLDRVSLRPSSPSTTRRWIHDTGAGASPVVAVRGDARWKTLGELMADAKARPGIITVGNSGIGSHTHISSVALFHTAGVTIVDVPYAAAQVVPISDLRRTVDVLVQLPGALAAQVKSGNVRLLATMIPARDPALPDVPTAKEQGIDVSLEAWRGIAVPRGTPGPAIAALERSIRLTARAPEFARSGREAQCALPTCPPRRGVRRADREGGRPARAADDPDRAEEAVAVGEVVLGIGASHSPMLEPTPRNGRGSRRANPTLQLFDRDGKPRPAPPRAPGTGGEDGRRRMHPQHGRAERLRAAHRRSTASPARSSAPGSMRSWSSATTRRSSSSTTASPRSLSTAGARSRTRCGRRSGSGPTGSRRSVPAARVESGRTESPIDAGLAPMSPRTYAVNGFDAATRTASRAARAKATLSRSCAPAATPRRGEAPHRSGVPQHLLSAEPADARALPRDGRAIRAAVDSWPASARVGVLASGGLSHFAIDEPFDRAIIDAFRSNDAAALAALSVKKLNSGNSEIRNWIAAAGALERLPLAWAEYVPAYRSPAGTGTGLCFAAWRT